MSFPSHFNIPDRQICDNPEPDDYSVEDQAAIDNVQDFVDWLNRFGGVNVEVGAEMGRAWISLNDQAYNFTKGGDPDSNNCCGAFDALWNIFCEQGHKMG